MANRIGPRREALKSRRARDLRKRLTSATIAGGLATLLAVGGVILFVSNRTAEDEVPIPVPSASEQDRVTTTLLFGTKEQNEDAGALWMSVLSFDRENRTGAVVYIPAHAAVEVPGRGLQGIGGALASGGIPLLLVSAENLLGIEIDRYLELSDNDAELLFEATGSLSVNVPEEVRVSAGPGRARLLFTEGQQKLRPNFLTQLLYVIGLDGDDAELGLRHISFWDSLFDAFAEEPDNLSSAVRSAGGALAESDVAPADHAQLLAAIAALSPADRTIAPLPVQQVSVGGSELYSVDAETVAAFMSDTLGVAQDTNEDVRVQVLNGNGVPGIGQEVAEELVGAGFRVVLTGNARRLNYQKTLIITYDDSDEGREVAQRAKSLLGVGEIQVSVQEQGIVDLTIVVGKDFLQRR
jgi:polyisoprenyl-teichoic acid--peptidoglycan teichoic acid transferase